MMLSELHQDLVWHRRDGRPVALAAMDAGYCRNVIRMLERTAPSIQLTYTMAELTALTRPIPTAIRVDLDGTPVLASRRDWTSLMPSGEMAQDAFNQELEQRAADLAAHPPAAGGTGSAGYGRGSELPRLTRTATWNAASST